MTYIIEGENAWGCRCWVSGAWTWTLERERAKLFPTSDQAYNFAQQNQYRNYEVVPVKEETNGTVTSIQR